MSGAMGSHQSTKAKSTTWLTPLKITESLGPFDLDPCGYPGWNTARQLICLPDDGLSTPWEGRVWLNPPYGQEVWRWLDKLADHHHGTALIFARTETEGFVEQVWKKATAVRFLYGRLHFHHPDGTRARANAGAPSVLVAYGPEDAARLATCTIPGKFIHLRKDRQMTTEIDLTPIKERLAAATPGPLGFATAPAEDSSESPAEYIANALTGNGELYVVWDTSTEGDPEGYVLTAVTGDGPHASANAKLYAHAPSDLAALLAEVERLRGQIDAVKALHRPAHAVFSWTGGTRYDDPCPECHGAPGVHPCGCWADTQIEYVCAECHRLGSGSLGVYDYTYPCPTMRALDGEAA